MNCYIWIERQIQAIIVKYGWKDKYRNCYIWVERRQIQAMNYYIWVERRIRAITVKYG